VNVATPLLQVLSALRGEMPPRVVGPGPLPGSQYFQIATVSDAESALDRLQIGGVHNFNIIWMWVHGNPDFGLQ
jgi:hypothetical protein